MGGLGALAAKALKRALLAPDADVGHAIAVLSGAWAPIALAQVLISLALGTSVLPVLPVLALPFAAAVGLVNPGAGLWRPIPR
jgi:ABC-type Co2+ transport system permease subunit